VASVLIGVRAAKRDRNVPYLLDSLIDTNQLVRWFSARALGDLRIEEAVGPLLRGALQSPDEIFQSTCLRALEKIGDRSVVPELYQLASEERPFGVKTSALRTLAALGDRRAILLMAEIIVDPDLLGTYSMPTSVPRIAIGPAKRWTAKQIVAFRGVEAIPILETGSRRLGLRDRLRVSRLLQTLRRMAHELLLTESD